MIIIIEPNCLGLQHAVVNAGLIQVIGHAFPGITVQFVAETSHAKEVARLVSACGFDRLTIREVSMPDPREPSFRVFRAQLKVINDVLDSLSSQEPSLVVLSSADEPTIFAATLALRRRSRLPVSLQLVLHGTLGKIAGWRSRNPLRRATDMRTALRLLVDPRAHFLVLERAILDEAVKEAPWLGQKISALPHPLIPIEGKESTEVGSVISNPLRLGFLGLATAQKGFPDFLDLARKLRKCHGSLVEFHAYGRLEPGMNAQDQSDLTSPLGRERIERDRFIAGVESLHFVCLPYKGAHYRLSASGVLIDAISFSKPIFALEQPITTSLFDEFGDVGYLCCNMDEMAEKLDAVVNDFDESHYRTQSTNMGRARLARLPHVLARSYMEILHRTGYSF